LRVGLLPLWLTSWNLLGRRARFGSRSRKTIVLSRPSRCSQLYRATAWLFVLAGMAQKKMRNTVPWVDCRLAPEQRLQVGVVSRITDRGPLAKSGFAPGHDQGATDPSDGVAGSNYLECERASSHLWWRDRQLWVIRDRGVPATGPAMSAIAPESGSKIRVLAISRNGPGVGW